MVIECPNSRRDEPSGDLSAFVRFYDGDEGYERCPHCDHPILWRMGVVTDITRLPTSELKLALGAIHAAQDQLYAEYCGVRPDEEALPVVDS